LAKDRSFFSPFRMATVFRKCSKAAVLMENLNAWLLPKNRTALDTYVTTRARKEQKGQMETGNKGKIGSIRGILHRQDQQSWISGNGLSSHFQPTRGVWILHFPRSEFPLRLNPGKSDLKKYIFLWACSLTSLLQKQLRADAAGEMRIPVAQICNLLYRRIAFGRR
jgi:hypothetical protein